ncbi:MAG: hypothetical protein AAF525_17125 [Pseudomonadota bacterium]
MKRWPLLSALLLLLSSTVTFAEETSNNTTESNEATLAALDSAAAPFEPEESDPDLSTQPMDEMIVEGTAPDLNIVRITRIRYANGNGARLYRLGKYKEAYPLLLTAAKQGFKLAQARVSYIYQQGLGGVDRDAEKAVGWLGVAASPVSDVEIMKYHRRFMARVPETLKPQVDSIVEDYIAKYGNEANGMNCDRTRVAGTHISRLKCDFDEETDWSGFDVGDIEASINATGSFSLGDETN